MSKEFENLEEILEKNMAVNTALMLFEWDNETLAPKAAGKLTNKVIGILSGEYYKNMAGEEMEEAIRLCESTRDLTEVQAGIVREVKEERKELICVPEQEYREFAQLVPEATRVWAQAKENRDFQSFAPTLQKVVDFQKKFASYKAEDGQSLYNALLDSYEKGFDEKALDEFFGEMKEEIVPLLDRIREKGRAIDDSFLEGDYPEQKQEELARFMAEYVGFDFDKGVLSVSAHPFTTNLHNHDIRLTTHYGSRMDSSLFSVIHEAGHAIYEMGIGDELTQTPLGQGASMGMHESQSRFFENIIGRSRAFWKPLYASVQKIFPEQLKSISMDRFVDAVNKVEPGLIRTEADELTYSLHVMVRYEIEKMMINEDLDLERLPEIWNEKYKEYLGVQPKNDAKGVLQDIHWSQGSIGYFPSYALGSAFGAQIYYHMKEELDFDGLLEAGKVDVIREYLREHIHRYGKLKTSRQIIRDLTGEDFTPKYYIRYLKEKYEKLYGI